MTRIFSFILLFAPLLAFSQLTITPQEVDFGEIVRGSDRVVDFLLENKGGKDALLLRNGFTFEYHSIMESTSVPAGGSTTLRVKYNPRTKGPFREEVSLWFSTMDVPLMLTFKGEVLYIDNSDNPACPDFNARPADCCGGGNETLVRILDSSNGKPIRDARLRVVENGRVQQTDYADRQGEVPLDIPIAYYLLVADHDDYFPNDTANYVNRRNNFFEIYLDPREREVDEDTFVTGVTVYEAEETEPEVVEEINIRIEHIGEREPDDKEETVVEDVEEVVEDTSEKLPESRYAENNVVFLIDVSHSMAQQGKMELLQASMYELSGAMREIDRIALITYASQTMVRLPSTPGGNPQKVDKIVSELEAGGMTAGAKGFKRAYDMALDNFTAKGNNQVVVCTDGAFRVEDNEKIMKMVRKYERKGVKTSVVGIRSNRYASEKLAEIAELGHGTFIPMESFDVSQDQLLEEIRRQSLKQ